MTVIGVEAACELTRYTGEIHMSVAAVSEATVDILSKNIIIIIIPVLTLPLWDKLDCWVFQTLVCRLVMLFFCWSTFNTIGFQWVKFFTSMKLKNDYVD